LVALAFLLVGLALRLWTFGNTNLFVDDEFYVLVGQRMHEGALPYVDIWDRKPLGLFLLSYAVAAVSPTMLAWQIAAWLFAAATAFAIYRIVREWADRQGALLAGLSYLVLLGPLDGYGGQSPVFYNLLVATAALLIVRERGRLAQGAAGPRVTMAMTLCGLAIGIKQTAMFESAFFGLYVAHALHRAGVPAGQIARKALGYIALGAAPMLVFAAFYAVIGHWSEFWHAMVTSNFSKGLPEARNVWWQLEGIGMRLIPVAATALFGLTRAEPGVRRFLLGWLAAALIGFLAVPHFFMHYSLPALVPLSVTAGLALQGSLGRIAFVAGAVWSLVWYNPADFAWRDKSIASMDAMTAAVRGGDDGGGLFIYDGPPYLYSLAREPLVSPLTFPDHVNHLGERNVSHIATDPEVDRILANRPSVVALSYEPRNKPPNPHAWAAVRGYVAAHCRERTTVNSYAMKLTFPITIYGRCRTGR
jgi:hypothetical protein